MSSALKTAPEELVLITHVGWSTFCVKRSKQAYTVQEYLWGNWCTLAAFDSGPAAIDLFEEKVCYYEEIWGPRIAFNGAKHAWYAIYLKEPDHGYQTHPSNLPAHFNTRHLQERKPDEL